MINCRLDFKTMHALLLVVLDVIYIAKVELIGVDSISFSVAIYSKISEQK